MARSRKKIGGYSDREGSIGYKAFYLRLMNRGIRQEDVDFYIPNGSKYRRYINRWDYRDYSFRIWKESDNWDEERPWKPYIK